MSEVKQIRQKAGLVNRELLLGLRQKKEGVCPVGAKSGDLARVKICSLPTKGENSWGPKLNWS